MRKVIDDILFNDEIDMLLARMKILWPVVDEFIVYEDDHRFTGAFKEWQFIVHRDRFIQLEDQYPTRKITYCPSCSGKPHHNPWVNEERFRNRMMIVPGALNIMSDVDEIPSRDVIAIVNSLPDSKFPVTNLQNFYYYDTATKWLETCACSVFVVNSCIPNKMRQKRRRHTKIHGGWHFSYFGGEQQIKSKLGSFSHQEIKVTPFKLQKAIEGRYDFIETGKRGTLVRLQNDNDLPEYVKMALIGIKNPELKS